MNCEICNYEIEESRFSHAVLCSDDCFHIHFWNEKVKIKDQPNVIRVNGEHYTWHPENPKAYFKGHGGREFKIEFNDGRKITSRNIWYQGEIPQSYRKLLPDNAKFV